MQRFVIEFTGNPREYVEGIKIMPGRKMMVTFTTDVEKAALFTEEAATLFVMEAANVGLSSYWASPVKLELRMVVP